MTYILKISNLTFFLFAVLLGSSTQAAPYRVGIPIPLTGDTQAYGEEIRRGYELGKEILKANDVELIFENDECNPTKSVGIAKKLTEIDHVQVISGMFCNAALFASAPIYNRAGIPVLTCGANPGDKKGIGKKIFRLFPADQLGVPLLVKFISKTKKRLCMLTERDAYSELISRTTKAEWAKLGPEYQLFAEDVNSDNKDFRSVLLRLKQNKCDGLFINSIGDDGYIAAYKQAKDLQIEAQMYAYYLPGSSLVQKALGSKLDGVIYATLASNEELISENGRAFYKLFKERYGNFQVSVPVALIAFETLRLIIEAKNSGIPLDEFLKNRTIKDGAINEYYFDEDGAVQGIEFKIVRYEKGKEYKIQP